MGKTELIYGLHAVTALLKEAAYRIQFIYIQQGRTDQRLQEIIQLAESNDVATQPIARAKLDILVTGANHQGVIANCLPLTSYTEADISAILDKLEVPPFLLILDQIQDPHNLGACLRTADAAGIHAVLAPKDHSAAITPIVRKVASGAAETVPFIQVTNLARTLRMLRERGIWLQGMAGEGETSLYQADLTGPLGLVLGAEGKGIRRLTSEHCDNLLHIPMLGAVSSLNVAVATGICLFEAVRQRIAL